eukprot:CCRYP_006876-RB/>CCRYP_006876-RB protein AED:0.35 eAED:0.35 QI:322/1/1/1/0.5/0.33/3/443/255
MPPTTQHHHLSSHITTMKSRRFFLSLCQFLLLQKTHAECETEQDLDFESCDLIHLPDEALNDICHRIGLDLKSHVLPALLGMEEDEEAGVGEVKERFYTHEDYVRGAEECLMIEDEVNRLEEEDPDFEREALLEDPEVFAEMIAQIVSKDESLLKEISAKLAEDNDIMAELKDMLEENETLEQRPDVLGRLLAKYLSEDPSLLDEFDELFELVEVEANGDDEDNDGSDEEGDDFEDEDGGIEEDKLHGVDEKDEL